MTLSQRFLHRLAGEWETLLAAFHGLPDQRLLEPGVVDQWTARDLLVHLASWVEEGEKALPYILDGKRLPRYSDLYGGIDAFNAQVQDQHRALSPTQARARLEAAYLRLSGKLAQLPQMDPKTQNRLVKRIRLDTYGHWREHTALILAWRSSTAP